MRFVFHVMLGVSIAITTAGIALGLEARDEAASLGVPAHTSPTHRVYAEHLDIEETLPPPLPVSPRYGSEVGPTASLSWRLTEGTDGARVELCPTSDFDESRTRHIDVAERGAAPAADLADRRLVLALARPAGQGDRRSGDAHVDALRRRGLAAVVKLSISRAPGFEAASGAGHSRGAAERRRHGGSGAGASASRGPAVSRSAAALPGAGASSTRARVGSTKGE